MITIEARRVHVKGVVQGVGFRPFVYQLARKSGLSGWVRNTSGDVTIVVEGEGSSISQFLIDLRTSAPPQSHIESISDTAEPICHHDKFEILGSQIQEKEYQLISADLATCSDCQLEIFDPANRRYRYPFTNCTNCGPRFTIIEDIPYDRSRTTMRQFKMCPACQQEYDDPTDRRFHAQPNACTVCGPQLELMDSAGLPLPGSNGSEDAVSRAAQLLREGHILAIKGLGGFLLACDATSDAAVRRLRQRKQRPAKPFAIMFTDLNEVRKYCCVNDREANLLGSPASPIVLLKIKDQPSISSEVAPGLKHLGAMLPYTPLHHLLLRETDLPLVMTSGNLSEEPIAKDNAEAITRLGDIADYFLLHNRGIHSRYDDSVVIVEQNEARLVRRARGYAPYPIHLPFPVKSILACGPELKNTFCLTRENHAFVSQHVGDMENAETLEHFENTVRQYEKLFRIHPEIIACDLHPDYLSTKWAEEEARRKNLPLIRVQHHHAHIVSCLIDNNVTGPVIGAAMDGTGFGPDGRIWGSEFMVADYQGFERKGHLEYLPLPGGSAAIHKPYRIAIGYIYSLLGAKALNPDLPCLKGVREVEVELIKRQIDRSLNTPLTSSCGRLFDAVSALLGIGQQVSYEGQAAIELEAAAAGECPSDDGYPFGCEIENGVRIIRVKDTLSEIISDLQRGTRIATIAARFHNTIAQIVVQLCQHISKETNFDRIALSGGVFQNRRLLNQVADGLRKEGLTPLMHIHVPCNDGGISLGQAMVASQKASQAASQGVPSQGGSLQNWR